MRKTATSLPFTSTTTLPPSGTSPTLPTVTTCATPPSLSVPGTGPRGYSTVMLEVEAKYRTPDWSQVVRTLIGWGAVAEEPREEEDQYFNAPDRDFRQTDEAVRLRRVGSANKLTYKGPKRDAATKT